jgi:WD40 repeat protein/tetratricopeptide (TPR) repeat protein
MTNAERKSLDELSDESEKFEKRFERLVTGEGDEAARSGLIGEITGWMRAAAAQGRFIPLASADRRALKSLLEYWSLRLREQDLHLDGVDLLADFDPSAGVVLTADCPYPGLAPYTEDRHGSFFGRETSIAAYVARLEDVGNRILLIIGASGSGKSSLALAGILPRLAERHGGAWLFAPRMTPGAHPLAELAESCAHAIRHPDQAQAIEHSLAARPGEALGRVGELCGGKPLMLLIDQFEELLTLCRDGTEQRGFADVLCALSDPGSSAGDFSCRILLTLRTDHLARLESSNALKALHTRLVGEGNADHLSAIGFTEIRRAIKQPAEQVGLRFVPATLVDQLASQTAGLANGLPLLQFALRRLWDTRPTNKSGEPLDLITEEQVKSLSDVQHALGMVADGIFQTYSPSQKQICERLLQELVVLDESFEEPLRRRRKEAELRGVLDARFPATGDVDTVIRDFVSAGLLRRFGEMPDCQLEVTHEALLRHWEHINRLVTGAEVKERLHLIKQVGREASDWVSRNRADGYLSLRGERLDHAVTCAMDGWLAEACSAEYVEACRNREAAEKLSEERAREERERADAAERAREKADLRAERFRRYASQLAALVVFLLASVLAVGWLIADMHAVDAKREAFARKLAMAAAEEVDVDSQRGLLLAIEGARRGTLKESALRSAVRGLLLPIEATRLGTTRPGEVLPEVESALRSALRASRVRAVIKGYSGTFRAAAYTPDGALLATGDSLGGVIFWDVTTGLARRALFAHVDDVNAIAFTPDGQKMASGSKDGKVVVWDVESGKPLHVLSGHTDAVNGLAFSRPDGRRLATAGGDGSVRLWDVSAGRQVRALYGHIGRVRAVAFGRDERQLATAGDDGQVVVWDALSGRALYSLAFSNLFHIDLSQDGSMLAVAKGEDVEIWDTASRNRRLSLTGHTNAVLQVRFSRDQRHVASASYDTTVRVWRLPRDDRDGRREAEEVARLRPQLQTQTQTQYFTGLTFSPIGDTVAAAAREGEATIWSVTDGEELLAVAGHESPIRAVALSHDGRTIAAAGEGNGPILTWDMSGNLARGIFNDTKLSARAVAFSGSGLVAVAVGSDVLVGPRAGSHIRLSGHKAEVNDLAFNRDGSRLVSGSDDRRAIVWELPAGKALRVLDGHEATVVAVAYSADGSTIATGSLDETVRLWRADSGEAPRTLQGHVFGILDLAFTADGRQLITAGKDKTIRIWDVGTGKESTSLPGHADAVNAVAISGDRLATGADDGVRLWDLRSNASVEAFSGIKHGARSLAFSPDGRHLVAGGRDGVVRVYVMGSNELLGLADRRVRRGWTSEECRRFLSHEPCPSSRYNVLDEVAKRFGEAGVDALPRLFEEALKGTKGSNAVGAELLEAEVRARLGTAYVRAASNVFSDPEHWAEAAKGKPEELAFRFLVAARDASSGLVFDPESRARALSAYSDVRRARDLARAGELKESVAAFDKARAGGWHVPGEPRGVASRVFAVNVLSNAFAALGREATPTEVRDHTKLVELALKGYPELGPGHRLLGLLYERQNDPDGAEKHYLEAASKESSAEPLIMLARLTVKRAPGKAADYATTALTRDGASDIAWFWLGVAENELKDWRKAAVAFDQVSASSTLSVDALNIAASIYFEYLEDNHTAYQRLTRAVQLAPNDLVVLANYAEILLASGRYDQAKLAAARARDHGEAQSQGRAYMRAAMSFVLFGAELRSGERAAARAQLDQIERHVKAAAAETGEDAWIFRGIRRSLDQMTREPNSTEEEGKALLKVLEFVESNGKAGTLSDMKRLLPSRGG